MVDWRKQVPDEIHGKSASQLFWVQRGFDTQRVPALQHLDDDQTYRLIAPNQAGNTSRSSASEGILTTQQTS